MNAELRQRLRDSLRTWVEENLGEMLAAANDDDAQMRMPVIEDFALIVAIEDASNMDSQAFFTLGSYTSDYRRRGLYHEALLIEGRSE